MPDMFRLDANESAFFKRQLEYIKTKTYDVMYKELKYPGILPVSTETPNGATTITWRSFEGVGFAKWISDYANDFPRVDVIGTEHSVKPKGMGDSYGYSIEEIRRAQFGRFNLNARRAKMARRAIEEKLNTTAIEGDDEYGLNGLIDYPGITEYTVPADGTGTSKLWSTKTPDEIIRDMSSIVSLGVMDPTNGVEIPDTMLMPLEHYEYISNTRMTGGSDKTIMKFFMENNPHIKTIDWLTELKGAGAGGTDRYMVYKKNPDKLTFEIPQMFEQFAPQQKGMEFQIPCHAKTGGVIVYYPLSIAFGDGI